MILAGAAAVAMALPAVAHHGWAWTSGGLVEVTGVVAEVRMGNPHGIVHLDAGGDVWTVEMGQPWRHANAGMNEADVVPGLEMVVIGEPSANIEDRLVKAVRVSFGGASYDLYPNRL